MSSQLETASCLMTRVKSILYGAYVDSKCTTATPGSLVSIDVIWSLPAVSTEPGVLS